MPSHATVSACRELDHVMQCSLGYSYTHRFVGIAETSVHLMNEHLIVFGNHRNGTVAVT